MLAAHLIKYAYSTGKHEILSEFTDIREARAALQALVYDYILKMDGANRFAPEIASSIEQICLLSARKMKLEWLSPNRIKVYLSKMPFGHYIITDCHDHIDKWSIWCHNVEEIRKPGYIYGEYKNTVSTVRKIFDIDLVCKYFDPFSSSYTNMPDEWQDEFEYASSQESVKLAARMKLLDVMETLRKNYETLGYNAQPSALIAAHPNEFSKYRRPVLPPQFDFTQSVSSMQSLEESFRNTNPPAIDLPLPSCLKSEVPQQKIIRLPPIPSINEIQTTQFVLATAAANAALERIAKRASVD
jgi:hypothetical protein